MDAVLVKKSEQGFTLLEMLLTIVVIAMMVYVGVNAYKRSSRDTVIEHSAKQIQNLLRNAIQYYGIYGKWPTTAAELTGASSGTGVSADICSPWPASSNANCNNSAPYEIPSNISTAKYYELSVKVPVAVGPLLASRVPHSTYSATSGILTAYTFVPLQPATSTNRGYLWGAGVGRGNDSRNQKNRVEIDMPVCAPGYEGHYLAAPLNVGTDHTQKAERGFRDFTWGIRLSSEALNSSTRSLQVNLSTVDVRNKRIPTESDSPSSPIPGPDDDSNHNAMDYFSYITFCLPPSLWMAGAQ
jgi:prepilin-type N-terminal cleavage/methylation domain-containing protein